MSYQLKKPCSIEEKANFIVEHNHNKGLKIVETQNIIFALENWETIENEKVIDNIENYNKEKEKTEKKRIQNLTCTKRNFVLIIEKLGITYKKLKELISTNESAQLEWDLCNMLERSNPLLEKMGEKINITPYILDKIFMFANGEINNLEEINL